jgi:hypothetical protein
MNFILYPPSSPAPQHIISAERFIRNLTYSELAAVHCCNVGMETVKLNLEYHVDSFKFFVRSRNGMVSRGSNWDGHDNHVGSGVMPPDPTPPRASLSATSLSLPPSPAGSSRDLLPSPISFRDPYPSPASSHYELPPPSTFEDGPVTLYTFGGDPATYTQEVQPPRFAFDLNSDELRILQHLAVVLLYRTPLRHKLDLNTLLLFIQREKQSVRSRF